MKQTRTEATQGRHRRIRRKVVGTGNRPRLAVFRSHQHIYAQIIDDDQQHTLASASTVEADLKEKFPHGNNRSAAEAVGKVLAQRALAAGVEKVVFDRGGNLYHGRVQALADAARDAGLEF